MNLETFTALVLAIVASAGSVWSTVKWVRKKFASVYTTLYEAQERVTAIWDFLKVRGEEEAIDRGLATMGPTGRLILNPEVRARFVPIEAQLHDLGREPTNLRDSDSLMPKISMAHKRWLIKHICLPLDLRDMTCIRMAMSVALEARARPSNAS